MQSEREDSSADDVDTAVAFCSKYCLSSPAAATADMMISDVAGIQDQFESPAKCLEKDAFEDLIQVC